MRPRLILPFVLLAVAAAIAGCGSSNNSSAYGNRGAASSASGASGGSSSVSAAAYVKSACSALAPVVTDLRSKEAAVAGATTPQDAKSALEDFTSTLSTGLGSAIPKLQAAGTPNVSNGAQIESGLVGAFTQLKTAMADASSQIGSVSTDNAAAFKAGFQSIATNLKSSTAGIHSSLQGLQSPELKSAAKAEPTCASLNQAG